MDISLYTSGLVEGPQHAGMLPCNTVEPVTGQPYPQQRNINAWNGNLPPHPIFPRVHRSIQRFTEPRGQTFTKRLLLNTLG